MKKGKYTKLSEADEVSYLGLFFPKGHPTSDVIDRIRLNILNGVPSENSGISMDEVYSAQQFFVNGMPIFDKQVPLFAQDVTKNVLGDSISAIVLTKGDLYDENDVLLYHDTFLPYNLGTNPWQLFERDGNYSTIDDRITFESALRYIEANRNHLRDIGCKKFKINSSYVYFFDEVQLNKIYGQDGILNLERLTADVIETNGYVGTEKIEFPNWEDAKKRLVPSVSYRQKHSIRSKSKIKLAQKKGNINGPKKQNADVIAIRFRGSEEHVSEMIANFRGYNQIGRFELQEIASEDYFTKPKKNGFRSFNLITRLMSQAGNWPIEAQFHSFHDYHKAEIDQTHPAHHSNYKEKQRIPKKNQELTDTYESIFRLIFPETEVWIDI